MTEIQINCDKQVLSYRSMSSSRGNGPNFGVGFIEINRKQQVAYHKKLCERIYEVSKFMHYGSGRNHFITGFDLILE